MCYPHYRDTVRPTASCVGRDGGGCLFFGFRFGKYNKCRTCNTKNYATYDLAARAVERVTQVQCEEAKCKTDLAGCGGGKWRMLPNDVAAPGDEPFVCSGLVGVTCSTAEVASNRQVVLESLQSVGMGHECLKCCDVFPTRIALGQHARGGCSAADALSGLAGGAAAAAGGQAAASPTAAAAADDKRPSKKRRTTS